MERLLAVERNVRIAALIGAVTIAFSSILVRLSHASPSTAAIFRCAYALPALGLIAWLEDRRYGSRSWQDRRFAVYAGVFFAADLIMWHHSIEDVGAGLATVLANIQVVLVPLVAWAVLAERPSRRVLAALPLALLGVLMISGVLEHGAYGPRPDAGGRVRVRSGSRVRRLSAAAPARRHGFAQTGRAVVRRDVCRRRGVARRRRRDRRRAAGPDLAGRRVAAGPGVHLAGVRVAIDQRVAAAATGGADLAAALRAADRVRVPGVADLLGVAERLAVGRGARGARRGRIRDRASGLT
jgi:uncharacterized membrane protein